MTQTMQPLENLRVQDPSSGPRKRDLRIMGWRLGLIVALLLVWAAGATQNDLIPSIPATFRDLYDGLFVNQAYLAPTWFTLRAVLVGLVIAVFCATVVGVLLGRNRYLSAAFEPILSAFFSVPRIVLYPALVVSIGVGFQSEYLIAALAAFFPMAVEMAAGVRSVSPTLNNLGRAFGLSTWQTIRFIVVPTALPSFMLGLRISFSSAYLTVLFAELIASTEGIGVTFNRAYTFQQQETLFSLLILTVVVAGIGQWILWRMEKLTDW